MKNSRYLVLASLMAPALCASAHTVLLSEDFNGDYNTNFPTIVDLDHQAPQAKFRTLFLDSNGVTQPWWHLQDSNASPEHFLCSHSAYSPEGKSNDWAVSRAIEVPAEGFTLTFDAQSFVMRSGDRLSDLSVFILEAPFDQDNLPTEPTLFIPQVSEGNFPNDIENDFQHYSISLDGYAGKTIWIAFANLNEDKDILAIDNVLVQRLDNAELTAASEEYALGSFSVKGSFGASADVDLHDWKLTFDPGNGAAPEVLSGDLLKVGDSRDFEFKADIQPDAKCPWTVTFEATGENTLTAKGNVTGMAFMPYHRVLLEESTGTWCGNCPLGTYAIEQMVLDEEMGKYVIPVAVHIPGSGSVPDPMINTTYAGLLGINSAPALRIDRSLRVTYFSTEHDVNGVDTDNTLTVAHAVKTRHEQTSLIDIDLKADFVIAGQDTTAINATVTLRPAVTLPSERYGVGFILTENNVGMDDNICWQQTNYMSGVNIGSGLDGLTEMPGTIYSWRFQDVGREVYGFRGLEDVSLPASLAMDEPSSATVTLAIPDTYADMDNADGTKFVTSKAIVAANTVLVAYIVDHENSNAVVNAISFPMSEQAEQRLSIAEQYERYRMGGVSDIADAATVVPAEYYTLQGLRVAEPVKGQLYIVKRGQSATKSIF